MAEGKKSQSYPSGGGGGAVYFFGFIGAAVYYISIVDGFWNIIVAVLKAFVWPAFLIYELLQFLKA